MGLPDDGKEGRIYDITAAGDEDRINWGYFRAHMGLYYDMGEYAVIFTDIRSPYHILKIANLDITDGDSNYDMADFLLENWQRGIEGLVKIQCVYVGTCDAFHYQLFMTVRKSADAQTTEKARNVLDLEKGDEILMVRMELLPYLGLSHPDLSKDEMIDRVASAAYSIGSKTGIILTDLKPANYGFRSDGSAAIFDFNIEEGFVTKDEYKKRIANAA